MNLSFLGGFVCFLLSYHTCSSIGTDNVASEREELYGLSGIFLGGGFLMFSGLFPALEVFGNLCLGVGLLFCAAGAIWIVMSEDKWRKDKKRVTPGMKRICTVFGILVGTYGVTRLSLL